MERRLLQIAVALACVVPVGMGGLSVLRGAGPLKGISGTLPTDLDSHYRYLSGLLLGVGLAFIASIPTVERRTELFRTLGLLIVVGGLARLVSLIVTGVPSEGHVFGLFMELVATPLIVWWQGRIARAYAR